MEILRGMVTCSIDNEAIIRKKLLWLYVPDFTKGGRMGSIQQITSLGNDEEIMWEETAECAGFEVSDECPWRVDEMELVKYTPLECLTEELHLHCETLQSYARF